MNVNVRVNLPTERRVFMYLCVKEESVGEGMSLEGCEKWFGPFGSQSDLDRFRTTYSEQLAQSLSRLGMTNVRIVMSEHSNAPEDWHPIPPSNFAWF